MGYCSFFLECAWYSSPYDKISMVVFFVHIFQQLAVPRILLFVFSFFRLAYLFAKNKRLLFFCATVVAVVISTHHIFENIHFWFASTRKLCVRLTVTHLHTHVDHLSGIITQHHLSATRTIHSRFIHNSDISNCE